MVHRLARKFIALHFVYKFSNSGCHQHEALASSSEISDHDRDFADSHCVIFSMKHSSGVNEGIGELIFQVNYSNDMRVRSEDAPGT